MSERVWPRHMKDRLSTPASKERDVRIYKNIWEDPFLQRRMADWFSAGAPASAVWENLWNQWDDEKKRVVRYTLSPHMTQENFESMISEIRRASPKTPASLAGTRLVEVLRSTPAAREYAATKWSNTTNLLVAGLYDICKLPDDKTAEILKRYLTVEEMSAGMVRKARYRARTEKKFPYTDGSETIAPGSKRAEDFRETLRIFTGKTPEEIVAESSPEARRKHVERHREDIDWSEEDNRRLLAGLRTYAGLTTNEIDTFFQDWFEKRFGKDFSRTMFYRIRQGHPGFEDEFASPLSPTLRARFEELLQTKGLDIRTVQERYIRRRRKR